MSECKAGYSLPIDPDEPCQICGATENEVCRWAPKPAHPAPSPSGYDPATVEAWIAEGIDKADRCLNEIGPVSANTHADIVAGRVAAYQYGYQIGVKSALTDATYVIARALTDEEAGQS